MTSRAEALTSRPELRELYAAGIALLLSIAIGSVLILIVGKSPAHVWWAMVTRTATDPYQLGFALYKATGLILAGLSVSIALDAGLFNIGAEGQVIAGVLVCAVVGAALPAGTPAAVAIPLCMIAAAAAGGAVGAAIGVLRVTRGAHEVITSIMFNEIIAGIVLYLGNKVVFPDGSVRSAAIAPVAELPVLGLGGSSANASILIALGLVVAVWWLRAQTTWGQAWRAIGQSPEAARTTGISVGKVQIVVMTCAGGLAGLAATNFVLGNKHVYEQGLGAGTGLLGISAALLGRMHPIGVAAAALVLGFLSAGGIAVNDLVPKELTEILQGVVVLAIAISVPWVRRIGAAR